MSTTQEAGRETSAWVGQLTADRSRVLVDALQCLHYMRSIARNQNFVFAASNGATPVPDEAFGLHEVVQLLDELGATPAPGQAGAGRQT